MTFGMTAFASRRADTDDGSLVWEIRSVNNRFLEVRVRLPDALRALEGEVRARLKERLRRGKIECALHHREDPDARGELPIDENLVRMLREANERIQGMTGHGHPLDSQELLKWPGVVEERRPDAGALSGAALELFDRTLDELVAARGREGGALADALRRRAASIREMAASLRKAAPDALAARRSALLERVERLKVELDPARLEQEVVLLAQKADVDEELDRLDAHLDEVERTLAGEGQQGRRLDFLMQELNREANTLSAKSVSAEATRAAVEIKVLVEQMREQVQNIE